MSNTLARVQKINALVSKIGELADIPVRLYRYNRVTSPAFEPLVLPISPERLPLNANTQYPDSITYSYYAVSPVDKPDTRNYVTMFNISPFPGCCALCISNSTIVNSAYFNRGINKMGIQLRQAIGAYLGYTAILCTDIQKNDRSIKSIEGAKFIMFHDLINKRTGNRVNLYYKNLED